MVEVKDKVETRQNHPYTVSPGTTLFTGVYGEGSPQGHADVEMKVRPLVPPTSSDGKLSFYMEVESPPEKKGQRFWVAKSNGKEGWLRI